jgi:hypothetical protein
MSEGYKKTNYNGVKKQCSTISLKAATKLKLDCNRTAGQCYDGFISDSMVYWGRYRISSSFCSPGKPILRDVER